MKKTITLLLLLLGSISFAQLSDADFDNLLKIADIYSNDVNGFSEEFKPSLEALRSKDLNHLIDGLIAVGAADEVLLTDEFLTKPSVEELKYWYVIREIHYNRVSKTKEPRPVEVVAREVLEGDIDSRWLLHNYYSRIMAGVAMLFNETDLSDYNFELSNYGLENDMERAVLFLNLQNAMTQRFKVLNAVNKPEKLLEFATKLPSFNGLPYYQYVAFEFEDFKWIGYEEVEGYKMRHLGNLFEAIYSHINALAGSKRMEDAQDIYYNSILNIPEYFVFSGELEKELKKLHKDMN